jgi:DNA-binding LytR/AlgR family response regulator
MQALNCLIVEDEPLAAGILEDYIGQVPGLKLRAACQDVFSATDVLRKETIDIIFLDINLPGMNGLDFLKTINKTYHVILTTAYHQYALEGYDLNVTDYLLKPIEFARFLKAVNKVFDRNPQSPSSSAEQTKTEKYYFFHTGKKQVKVFVHEILYIESLKDYLQIYTKDQKIITKFQISEMEKLMEENDFIRIHKSFIINSRKVSAFTATQVEVGSKTLPIGRTFKDSVMRKLRSL